MTGRVRTALTHLPSPLLSDCQLTFVERQPIDLERAKDQHQAYCELFERFGWNVVRWNFNSDTPDSAFVEDLAVILDEVIVLCAPEPSSRRAEVANFATAIAEHHVSDSRPIVTISPPATIEGGDVLRIERTLIVGRSRRTTAEGIDALSQIVTPLGYSVLPVPVHGCLHLKTACCAVNEETLLCNSGWIDTEPLRSWELLEVADDEPFAANLLRLDDELIISAAHRETVQMLAKHAAVHAIDISEFEKAEAGVTCLSLLAS